MAYGLHRDRQAQMITVRLFNTVGPRQTGMYGMVVPRFVRQALEGEDLTVYGNGTQTRCFAHVHDTVGGILTLFEDDDAVGGVFNIGSSDEIAIVELARRVIERSGSSSRIAARAVRRGVRRGLRGARPAPARHHGDPRADRLGARRAPSMTRSTT